MRTCLIAGTMVVAACSMAAAQPMVARRHHHTAMMHHAMMHHAMMHHAMTPGNGVAATGRCGGISYGTGARTCGTATGGPVGGINSRN